MSITPIHPPHSKTSYVSSSLSRALDIIDAASARPIALSDLADRLGLTRSTAYRLASALVARGLLIHNSRKGYQLGPKILALGYRAKESIKLVDVAQPVLDALSEETNDATNLAIRDGLDIIYVARSPGSRRLALRHDLNARNRLEATALGRALLWDAPAEEWRSLFPEEPQDDMHGDGFARHDEDGESDICCVAAPVRGASGQVIAALSLSSAKNYMPQARFEMVGKCVAEAATAISRELGWEPREERVSDLPTGRVRQSAEAP